MAQRRPETQATFTEPSLSAKRPRPAWERTALTGWANRLMTLNTKFVKNEIKTYNRELSSSYERVSIQ